MVFEHLLLPERGAVNRSHYPGDLAAAVSKAIYSKELDTLCLSLKYSAAHFLRRLATMFSLAVLRAAIRPFTIRLGRSPPTSVSSSAYKDFLKIIRSFRCAAFQDFAHHSGYLGNIPTTTAATVSKGTVKTK